MTKLTEITDTVRRLRSWFSSLPTTNDRHPWPRHVAPRPGRVPYVPTWHAGDAVVPSTPHDKRVYRLAENDHLVVVKQGPTFLLARNPRTDTMHHFTNRQAKRLLAFEEDRDQR